MKFIVCGGRNYTDKDSVFAALDSLNKKVGISLIIQGGAGGADLLASQWAAANGIHCAEVKAIWANGKSAGPARNRAMLTLMPDGVVAFPGGAGTSNMMSQAKSCAVKVWEPIGGYAND